MLVDWQSVLVRGIWRSDHIEMSFVMMVLLFQWRSSQILFRFPRINKLKCSVFMWKDSGFLDFERDSTQFDSSWSYLMWPSIDWQKTITEVNLVWLQLCIWPRHATGFAMFVGMSDAHITHGNNCVFKQSRQMMLRRRTRCDTPGQCPFRNTQWQACLIITEVRNRKHN